MVTQRARQDNFQDFRRRRAAAEPRVRSRAAAPAAGTACAACPLRPHPGPQLRRFPPRAAAPRLGCDRGCVPVLPGEYLVSHCWAITNGKLGTVWETRTSQRNNKLIFQRSFCMRFITERFLCYLSRDNRQLIHFTLCRNEAVYVSIKTTP